MTLTGIPAVTIAAPRPAAPHDAVTAASTFAGALASQEQQAAARGVLAALPAPIVYSLRDSGASPAAAVDRLFEVLKDGSFTPPAGPLGRPDSIIGATAHATTIFDSPDQLWDAMRAAIADPAGAASAFRNNVGPARASTVAGPPPLATPAAEVTTLEEAERLLTDIRTRGAGGVGGSAALSAREADWWEAALRFLLGARFSA